MPPFAISGGGRLTDQQVDALVNGMRAAWFKAGTLDGAKTHPTRPQSRLWAQGLQAYTTYCASCHGAAGAPGKEESGLDHGSCPSYRW